MLQEVVWTVLFRYKYCPVLSQRQRKATQKERWCRLNLNSQIWVKSPHWVKGTHESVLAVWRPCIVVHLAMHGQGHSLRVCWGPCWPNRTDSGSDMFGLEFGVSVPIVAVFAALLRRRVVSSHLHPRNALKCRSSKLQGTTLVSIEFFQSIIKEMPHLTENK